MFQDKLKSPVLKAGFVTLLLFLVKKYGNYDMPTELADVIIEFVMSFIIGLAIVNNPNNRDKLWI